MKNFSTVFFLFFIVFYSTSRSVKSQVIQIIGGSNINIDQIPWQVLFEINGEDLCGGAEDFRHNHGAHPYLSYQSGAF